MRTALFLMLCLFLEPVSCWAQQQVTVERINLPAEVRQEIVVPSTDADIKDLQWNRWTSDNFVVCSINDKQAQYLVANLENIKNWIYTRWGFENIKFVTECRLICVDDPKLFRKFFDLDESRAEIRYNSETNEPDLIVVFYLLDQTPSENVPGPLTEVCVSNIDETFELNSPPWVVFGMRSLNGTLPSIRSNLADIDVKIRQDESMYFSRGILETTEKQYKEFDKDHRTMFDNNSMVFTLFLRKKYGQKKFHNFYYRVAKGEKPLEVMNVIYGVDSYDKMDQLYKSFMVDLLSGLKNGSLKNSSLQVNAE